MPGFTETSVYGALFAASGIPYTELLDRLVGFALERHERQRSYTVLIRACPQLLRGTEVKVGTRIANTDQTTLRRGRLQTTPGASR